MLMIYGKHKDSRFFLPMDMTNGVPVTKKIYATVYEDSQKEKLKSLVETLHKDNKDWKFEIRHTN